MHEVVVDLRLLSWPQATHRNHGYAYIYIPARRLDQCTHRHNWTLEGWSRPFCLMLCGMQLSACCIRSTFRPHPMPLLHRLQCKFCYSITIAQCAVVLNIGKQRILCENSISRLSRASCPAFRWSSYMEL